MGKFSIDPGTAILGGDLLGAFGGLLKPKDPNKLDRYEQAREFNLNLAQQQENQRTQNQLQQTGDIGDLQRRIEQAPARDKALYMLNQRLGLTPQAFHPRDMMNPSSGPVSGGGIDPSVLQAAMTKYQAPDFNGGGAGSGGVDPNVYHQMMARLGMSGPYGHQTIGDVPITTNTTVGGQGPMQPTPSPAGAGLPPGPPTKEPLQQGPGRNPIPAGGNPFTLGGAPPPMAPMGARPPMLDPSTAGGLQPPSPQLELLRRTRRGY